jgi:acyl-CoA thioester hydrolase
VAAHEFPLAGVFTGREHRLAVRVYYEDTDFTGLVYHASYVRFFERGRSDFLRLAGADHVAMAALGTAFALTRLEVDFRRAARIDDALVVATQIALASGPRLRFAQQIERGGELICNATVEAACIDAAGRARRPPSELRRALAPYLPSS